MTTLAEMALRDTIEAYFKEEVLYFLKSLLRLGSGPIGTYINTNDAIIEDLFDGLCLPSDPIEQIRQNETIKAIKLQVQDNRINAALSSIENKVFRILLN